MHISAYRVYEPDDEPDKLIGCYKYVQPQRPTPTPSPLRMHARRVPFAELSHGGGLNMGMGLFQVRTFMGYEIVHG